MSSSNELGINDFFMDSTMPLLIFGLLILSSSSCLSYARSTNKKLRLPPRFQTLETVATRLQDVVHINNFGIFTLPQQSSQIIFRKFLAVGAKKQRRFGKITAAKRLPFVSHGQWNSIFTLGDNTPALLDGSNLNIAIFDASGQFKRSRAIIWDLILPPMDAAGEPPAMEVKLLRKKFINAMKKSPHSNRLTGLASFSKQKNNVSSYIVSTSIKDFPVVTMFCSKRGICRLKRSCFLYGMPKGVKFFNDVAITNKNKYIIVSHSYDHSLLVFLYKSCFHISYYRKLLLPKQLKKITGIHIDYDQRLWVTTSPKDDYLNASLYIWEPRQWL